MDTSTKVFKHLRFWMFVMPILMAIFLPFPNISSLTRIPAAEIQNYKLIFGEERALGIEERTDQQFEKLFIRSGIYKIPSKDHAETGEFQQASIAMGGWVSGYMTRFWALTYRALYRFNFLVSWSLSGALLFIFAAVYDGQQVRNGNKYLMTSANPVLFHFLIHVSLLTIGLVVSWCFMPFALSPIMLVITTMLMALLGWWSNASYLS